RAKKKLVLKCPKEPYKCSHCRRRAQRLRLKRRFFSIAGDWRRRPAAAAKPLPAVANHEDAIRSKRLVPYEVDSATVAWLLAHNQQLSPPVDQHGVARQATALAQSTADAEESAESLRNLGRSGASTLQAQLGSPVQRTAQLSAQLAAAESRCSESLAEERDRLGIGRSDIWRQQIHGWPES
uniref:DM domain-containing protein n=1 Tax=Macrostomum lignano TaxID=282301 RepID=A0A1I8FH37_9PLAT